MTNRFNFGDGHVFIGNIEIDGVMGVVVSHSKQEHDVDAKNPEWTGENRSEPYTPKDDDVLLMATTRDGARVLQNMVNALCLLLDGFTVSESESTKGTK